MSKNNSTDLDEKKYQSADATQCNNDEVSLIELWHIAWKGKWLIVAITGVFSIAAVLYALSEPDEYQSTVILAPASSSSSSSLSKLASRFGGLASLAGIDIGGGGQEDKSVIAIEIIKTWGFLETFIKDNNIEVELYAAEGWTRATNQLQIDPELYDSKNKKWVRDFDPEKGQKAEPSSWELYEEIIEKISISKNQENGLISLSVEYYSPEIAKQWTDKLVKAINAYIQKQDRQEAIKSINYLNKKIKETNLSGMQTVFYQLIEEQTKTLMLAEVSDEYVFRTISEAKVAEEKSNPKRAFIAILGFTLGGIIAVAIVLIRHFSSRKTI